LALDIINHQIAIGIRFDYLGGDAFYGADQGLTDAIDNMAVPFLMDIRENQHAFLERPLLEIPKQNSTKGRKPKRLKANRPTITVSE
jgi:hypothetical protein